MTDHNPAAPPPPARDYEQHCPVCSAPPDQPCLAHPAVRPADSRVASEPPARYELREAAQAIVGHGYWDDHSDEPPIRPDGVQQFYCIPKPLYDALRAALAAGQAREERG